MSSGTLGFTFTEIAMIDELADTALMLAQFDPGHKDEATTALQLPHLPDCQ